METEQQLQQALVELQGRVDSLESLSKRYLLNFNKSPNQQYATQGDLMNAMLKPMVPTWEDWGFKLIDAPGMQDVLYYAAEQGILWNISVIALTPIGGAPTVLLHLYLDGGHQIVGLYSGAATFDGSTKATSISWQGTGAAANDFMNIPINAAYGTSIEAKIEVVGVAGAGSKIAVRSYRTKVYQP